MAYIRKTVDRWDIETNYGYGWEVESSYNTYKEAKVDYTEYLTHMSHYGGAVRLKHRMIKKATV